MSKLVFDRSDYSGKKATIMVSGDKFTLIGLDDAHWEMRKTHDTIIMKNQRTEQKFDGYEDNGKFYFSHLDIEREDKNPMVAFGKLMWSL